MSQCRPGLEGRQGCLLSHPVSYQPLEESPFQVQEQEALSEHFVHPQGLIE